VENIDTFIIRGNATIDCNNRWTQRIKNIRSVLISGLTFASCEQDIFIDDVEQLVIENSTFRQRLRIDDAKVAEIWNTSFLSGTQILYVRDTSITIQQCSFENNMMGLLAEHSNVTINRSIFRKNFSPSRYRTFAVLGNVNTGGAIYMIQRFRNRGGMTLTISNSEFRDNSVVSSGGAIYLTDGNITITNTTFVNSSARSSGGAIYASNQIKNDAVEMHITQSSFMDNRADSTGGAIVISHSIKINRCSFVNNTAKRGGGAVLVIRDNSSISVSESSFILNSASYCGVLEINGASHSVKLTKSTFAQNRARGDSDIEHVLIGRGERDDIAGVLCVRNASISVLKSEFSQNSATGYGGVLYVDDSKVNIRESTFNDNSAGVDGGVTYTEHYQVQFRISHSLFTNNQAGGQGGVLAARRSGSHVGAERSTFGNNTANDRGGVFFILGGSLKIKETNLYGNEAKSGGVISACHSEVVAFDDLVDTADDVYPVCSHYDGEIDGFNITAPTDDDDVITTKPAPMDLTTSTPTVDTTISTVVTATISTESDTTESTTTRIPIPDTTTSPLSVYFVLKGSIYLNYSAIFLEEVGEGDDALICRTNDRRCCATPPNRAGEFYYPKGDIVPIRSQAEDFYRNRGEGEIRLNRIPGSTAVTGRFSCAIPDANGIIQVAYIYLL
jgi:predicted outer membrane repeat protein